MEKVNFLKEIASDQPGGMIFKRMTALFFGQAPPTCKSVQCTFACMIEDNCTSLYMAGDDVIDKGPHPSTKYFKSVSRSDPQVIPRWYLSDSQVISKWSTRDLQVISKVIPIDLQVNPQGDPQAIPK